MAKTLEILHVHESEQLQYLCERLQGSAWLAIDTEFLREKTYYPKLCLLQLANESIIACVDPLSIEDLTPLFDIIYDQNIVKVLHSARQDYEIFFHLTGKLPAPVFDTQIAAAICNSDEQISYAALVEQVVGCVLEKGCTRTDWTQRPLAVEQYKYAEDDVRYLGEIYTVQKQMMQDQGVLAWHAQECQALLSAETYQVAPQNMWLRIKEHRRLKASQLVVLQQLAAWREEQAIKRNKPRRWILKDEVLVDLARYQPEELIQLEKVKGLSENFLARHSENILTIIKQAKVLPSEQWPSIPKRKKLGIEEQAKEDVMMALIRKAAMDHGVASSVLGGRKDLDALLNGDEHCRFLHGWRYEVIGKTLQDFLHGEITVTIEKDHLKIESSTDA